jgi:hypothetical protein
MRSAPHADASIVARLSYTVVYGDGGYLNTTRPRPDGGGWPTFDGSSWQSGPFWFLIDGPFGLKGFVPNEVVRDPTDWHVCFAKRPGGWKIVEIDRLWPGERDLP